MNQGRSVYTIIAEQADEKNMLPVDFRLPVQAKTEGKGVKDGELDGMVTFHRMPFRSDLDGLKDIVQLSFIDPQNAMHRLDSLFSDETLRMLPMYEDFRNWLIESASMLDAESLFSFAAEVLVMSPETESVKLALILLELLDTGDNDAVRDAVRTLALSDEFTLFSVLVAETWQDGNDIILDMAMRTHGWGRIQAVEHLEPENGRIKRWLFTEGVENTISPSYSASTIADKLKLYELMQNPAIDAGSLIRISRILSGLLVEGNVFGLTARADRELLLTGFAALLERFPDVRKDEGVRELTEGILEYLSDNIFPGSTALESRYEKLKV